METEFNDWKANVGKEVFPVFPEIGSKVMFTRGYDHPRRFIDRGTKGIIVRSDYNPDSVIGVRPIEWSGDGMAHFYRHELPLNIEAL